MPLEHAGGDIRRGERDDLGERVGKERGGGEYGERDPACGGFARARIAQMGAKGLRGGRGGSGVEHAQLAQLSTSGRRAQHEAGRDALDAKIAAGYFTPGSAPDAEALKKTKGRGL